jgi:CDP-diacylglycerol---glycerol-3-phosphate 3-phosphatidyltransferase
MEKAARKERTTFTDVLRKRFKNVVEPTAAFLLRTGLTPNMVTTLGLVGNIIGAYCLAIGQISLGGIILLLSVPLDALDGTMARLSGRVGPFGAFFDSVTDRYSELFIFGGLLFYFMGKQDSLAVMLVYMAAAGSVMVSYTRARAQAVGVELKEGFFSRVERFLILLPCLIFNQAFIAVVIIAIFSNITAIQRVWFFRKKVYSNPVSSQ